MVNSIGIKLVWIPPGEFLMGSPPGEEGRDADERLHRVRITRPFYLAAHEVTVGQFRQFIDATGYRTDGEGNPDRSFVFDPAHGVTDGSANTWRKPGFPQEDCYPVVEVSWNDATAFCQWLGRLEGRAYRLPTEAEWEYACRAGISGASGEDVRLLYESANVCNLSSHMEGAPGVRSRGLPMPVGSFPKNAFGLYDMQGNVAEWCADWYAVDYGGSGTDPAGPETGTRRVLRGGSYLDHSRLARAANRWTAATSYCDFTTGFRVAMNHREADGK